MSKRDYYEVLEVDRGATEAEIKRAYRRKARECHPDHNPDDPRAEERFKELSEAAAVLLEPEKRKIYDRYGHDGLSGQGGIDMSSIFEQFFGGGFGGGIFDDLFGGGRGRRPNRGSDLRYDMQLEFEEAAFGAEKEIVIPGFRDCPECDGSGARPGTKPQTCHVCGGRGQVRTVTRTPFGQMSQITTCRQCAGAGRIVSDPCPECAGQGQVRQERRLSVKIPAGVETGVRIRLAGEGEQGEPGGVRGDLYVFIHVKSHEFFDRDGQDLLCEIPISMVQAALGATIEIPTLREPVTLKIPTGTQSGQAFTVKGQGLASIHGYGNGNLIVQARVATPTKLTPRQKELLREFADEGGESAGRNDKGFFGKVREVFGAG